jgi:hypothetical protein
VFRTVIVQAALNVRSNRGLFLPKGTTALIEVEGGVFIHPRKWQIQFASNIPISEA